jgi:hypothetical protein
MKPAARYVLILFLLAMSAFARSGSQNAHTHGLATLTLVLENGVVEIQFESPAANFVGFEHKAASAKEKQAVIQAEATLKEPTRLFSFNGTNCQPGDTRVDVSDVVDDEHQHHGHSKEHDESGHSEISAEYHFSCKNPEKLVSVSVALIELFPGIEKINAMWITETKQGAVPLTPNNNAISFN